MPVVFSYFSAACIGSLAILAADVVDLGVIGDVDLILLTKCERRVDFGYFSVEVVSRSKTNRFVTTNTVLRLADFSGIPDGPAILGVRSVCQNGSVSELSERRINLQRLPPDAPGVSVSRAFTNRVAMKLSEAIAARKKEAYFEPPVPLVNPLPVKPQAMEDLKKMKEWMERDWRARPPGFVEPGRMP